MKKSFLSLIFIIGLVQTTPLNSRCGVSPVELLAGLGLFGTGLAISTYSFHQTATYKNRLLHSTITLTADEKQKIKQLRLAGLGLIALGSIVATSSIKENLSGYIPLFLLGGSSIGLAELVRSQLEIDDTFNCNHVLTHSTVTLGSAIILETLRLILS